MKILLGVIAMMFALSLIYALLTGCSRTVKSVTEVHDTTEVTRHRTDTTERVSARTDTVKELRTDTVREISEKHDSVHVRDSVFVREKGDSVYIYKEKWNTKIVTIYDTVKEKSRDTVRVTRTDTLVVYRYVETDDSSRQVKDSDNKEVKEKRSSFSWFWTILGLATFVILTVGCVSLIRKNS